MCGSRFHLIKDCTYHEQRMGVGNSQQQPRPMWKNVKEIPSYVPQTTYRSSRCNSADKQTSQVWRRTNRPYVQSNSSYDYNGYWPGYFDSMNVGWGYWILL